jgi:hypothetical protein
VWNDYSDVKGWSLGAEYKAYDSKEEAFPTLLEYRDMYPSLTYIIVQLGKVKDHCNEVTNEPPKHIRFKMRDSLYSIPVSVIAHSRAKYYAEMESKGELDKLSSYNYWYKVEYENTLDWDDEAVDWLRGNLNWEDIKLHVSKIKSLEPSMDQQWKEAEDFNVY